VLLYQVSVRFLMVSLWIEMLFAAGLLTTAIAVFIVSVQPFFRLEAKDGKTHGFYELNVSIEWNERGEQKRIPFRRLRIRAREVFIVDNAAVTEGGIKPFVIVHRFRKFTGMTRAKIRVPAEVSIGETFNLLLNGNAVAACRVEEDRA